MKNLLDGLTFKERIGAQHFLSKLDVVDNHHVRSILRAVDNVAIDFYNTPIENFHWGYSKKEKNFFTAYLIGGNLTKQGNREDIDLLVATNMRYPQGYCEYSEEWLVQEIGKLSHFAIELKTKIPDDYNVGETKGKGIIQLNSKGLWKGRKIDLVYYKSVSEGGMMTDEGNFIFNNETEFDKRDVDEEGNSLPRMILYRNNREIFSQQ